MIQPQAFRDWPSAMPCDERMSSMVREALAPGLRSAGLRRGSATEKDVAGRAAGGGVVEQAPAVIGQDDHGRPRRGPLGAVNQHEPVDDGARIVKRHGSGGGVGLDRGTSSLDAGERAGFVGRIGEDPGLGLGSSEASVGLIPLDSVEHMGLAHEERGEAGRRRCRHDSHGTTTEQGLETAQEVHLEEEGAGRHGTPPSDAGRVTINDEDDDTRPRHWTTASSATRRAS